jgi:pyruvate/2-oxoacid:ferredoxin oxidoreductase alpha subunit
VTRAYVTGNHAAGYTLAAAGEANRGARGCCSGVYPITPQTEIIECLSAARFEKGEVVPVESEHSAMAVCIGASIDGARAFTASSSNGLLHMTRTCSRPATTAFPSSAPRRRRTSRRKP